MTFLSCVYFCDVKHTPDVHLALTLLARLLVQETPVEELGGIAPTEPHEEIAVGL